MLQSECEIAGEALSRIHRGGKLASRFVMNDIGELGRELPLGFDLTLDQVHTVLTGLSHDANPELVAAITDRMRFRVLTGGGTLNVNPGVVTVEVTHSGERTTILHVRSVAKEGLVKQRAGGKTRLLRRRRPGRCGGGGFECRVRELRQ
ncbi:hypothetical protein MBT84_37620 [Streptomyces sp. MBT84]|nr:hypothetical protein [Streptomyces sp. MBT84]